MNKVKTIKLTYPLTLTREELPNTVAAIGFFDGIHLGHQQVIKSAVEDAKRKQMESAVITFHPHPSVVLKQGIQHVKYITPYHEKEEILRKLDVDRLYIITFNKELSLLSPQEFIDHFIVGLNIKHLVAGFDYTYGHKGQGNMQAITEHANGKFTTTTIDKIELDNEKISSTRIRALLEVGEIEAANLLLGRMFTLTGTVVEGDKRGRTIGYPTANININSDVLIPKLGVYAVKVIHNNHCYEGMANLGVKPTFVSGKMDPSIEVNIFNFDQNIYGEKLTIQLCKYIREEKKFENINALISQISVDENTIKRFFS